ncbi:ModE molybdate transport repressor domain-containing protein [Devosia enhydra]|uniref:ModE molybdate transport repressor domain-containing protein n=1 Tax=Devosia enhydra TaxID=665118 RepID=A0A1K2HZI4_9HYPH|nr:ModE molybdate transport repressor domain-containing protein [Devosia enhydra]
MDDGRIASLTLKQLEILAAVGTAGSITQAARRTGLSQPTVSHHISRLEAVLGAQLIIRGRGNELELTPAGEYWLRCAREVLGSLNQMVEHHSGQFAPDQVVLRFGATPTLRGRFLGAAARMAVSDPRFKRFESVWALNSEDVVEQLHLHQINCAVVSARSIRSDEATLSITPLFFDKVALVSPRAISRDLMTEAFMCRRAPPPGPGDALTRYVDVGRGALVSSREDEHWYRTNLPFAMPYFATPTHLAAIEFVAEGLATCLTPLSQLPGLQAGTLNRLNIFELDHMGEDIVLAMPRHLLSIPAFSAFRDALVSFARMEFSTHMMPTSVITAADCKANLAQWRRERQASLLPTGELQR